MFGSNQYAITLFGDYSNTENLLITFNFRYKILEALMNNLKAITKLNGFSIDIMDVLIGDDGTDIKDHCIVVSQIRDLAVIEYQGTSVNRNSYMLRSQSKLRNFYVSFKLFVKNFNKSSLTYSDIKLREDFIDEIIKGLYGYNEKAVHLRELLFLGISNDFGLVAYEVSETKPYSLNRDLNIKFEALFQYRLKYY